MMHILLEEKEIPFAYVGSIFKELTLNKSNTCISNDRTHFLDLDLKIEHGC